MSNKSSTHETVAWAKQRLDDVDAIISEAEKTAAKLKDDARAQADAALARLHASRSKVQGYYDQFRSEADAVKSGVDDVQGALEAEWVEVESAFQSFLSAAKDQAETVRDVVVARAQAQRKSWETSFNELRAQAEAAVEKARGDFDAAIKRLSDEAERFQARIGEAKDAGDESWTAVKAGVADAKAVHDRTIEKIKDAFSKLL
ncbi:hypothetical protein ACO2RV_22185 [Ancylobacter sp. VNQ12]|uniref:hypothetical protein n=1 Tax=Ancylobacter sp. VNQ12 TaxID=3400920 RepID=UPI003BFD3A7D